MGGLESVFVETHFQDDSHYETEITTAQLRPRVKVWYSRRHLRMECIMTCKALICLIRDISDGGGGGSQGAQ